MAARPRRLKVHGPDSKTMGSAAGNPAGRGGAGTYIEGELGAHYMLAMLAGAAPRGAPGTDIDRVQFQAVDQGYALDDVVVHGRSADGDTVLEIQSKRTITFSPKDPVFKEVCAQVVRSLRLSPVARERHVLAVATQRTSFKISGPYQDVLEWAGALKSSHAFFDRLKKGGASAEMREFVDTFRVHLVEAGAAGDDEAIWQVLRRFKIIEFDFEAGASQSAAYAKILALTVLSPADASRHEALWSVLIELSIACAKVGGSFTRDELRRELYSKGFQLEGERNFRSARAKLAEQSRHAVAGIGRTVAGVHLPRHALVAKVDEARDVARLVHLRGDPGSGKSSVLRTLIERSMSEAPTIVLDPIGTPTGGWGAMALRLGLDGTANEFLRDLASSGGATVFIDGLEMFTDPGKQRTVNDLLHEVATMDGISVVATARMDYGSHDSDWLSEAALQVLGAARTVEVGDLDEAELEVLREGASELRALLTPNHPAAPIARNLYRLSRLLKAKGAARIRTEAALATNWWDTADGAPATEVRAAQRIMASLVDAALAGDDGIALNADSPARDALLSSLTLREVRRDRVGFYHDVLRDWAIGIRVHEEPDLMDRLNLSLPAPAPVARGIEIAARLTLEQEADNSRWIRLLERLSVDDAHTSWRRHALLALVRSERAPELLERMTASLIENNCMMLRQLCVSVLAVETVALADLTGGAEGTSSVWMAVTPSATRLLRWCANHADDITLEAMVEVVRLGSVYLPLHLGGSSVAASFIEAAFTWLNMLDVEDNALRGSLGAERSSLGSEARRRLTEDLRGLCMLAAASAPDATRHYVRAIAEQRNHHKIKSIRGYADSLARVAPDELADLIATGLIPPVSEGGRQRSTGRDRPFDWFDSDFLPPSPAQPPFLALFQQAPATGLRLVRRLVNHALEFSSDEDESGDVFVIKLAGVEREFPRADTYYWSHGLTQDYAVGSALMALEAWGHIRLDAGEDIDDVLEDVLGPIGSPAAYLIVAVDLLISHWPHTRSALVPFLSSPQVLAADRVRLYQGVMSTRVVIGDEPKGVTRLADLQQRGSRKMLLEHLLLSYLDDEILSCQIRDALAQAQRSLGGIEVHHTFADPPFMAAYALNLLNRANWEDVEGGLMYRHPDSEARHLARRQDTHREHFRDTEVMAMVSLAVDDRARATPELVREAAQHAARTMPDPDDEDVLKSRATVLVSTAMLVVRDGDDALLADYREWVHAIFDAALKETDRLPGMRDDLSHNRPALAIHGLIHLWRRSGERADLEAVLAQTARKDRAGAPAFSHALDEIDAVDPRVAKSALRIAFSGCQYIWQSHDVDEEVVARYRADQAETTKRAIDAELAWLGGGEEPPWPDFIPETPTIAHGFRIPTSTSIDDDGDLAGDDDDELSLSVVEHADSQGAAAWLRSIVRPGSRPAFAWQDEIAEHYARWTAVANGATLRRGAEPERTTRDWNLVFYSLSVKAMLSGSRERLDRLLSPVEGLPDKAFSDVASTLLRDGDAWYFNNPDHPAELPVLMRQRVGRRLAASRFWQERSSGNELSVDTEAGPIVSTFFMSAYNPFTRTDTYLVPEIFDRIDPLLPTLRPMLGGGPTALVALCTISTLLVTVRARHADFVLFAAETWMERAPNFSAMWKELQLGRKVMRWLTAAAVEDPSIMGGDHSFRPRLDRVVGFLVDQGIPEAHQFEQRVSQHRHH